MSAEERGQRAFQALTLLVAVCEQVSAELGALDSPPLPLLNRLQEAHDLAIDLLRTEAGNEVALPNL
jgi:hypothetical protein